MGEHVWAVGDFAHVVTGLGIGLRGRIDEIDWHGPTGARARIGEAWFDLRRLSPMRKAEHEE